MHKLSILGPQAQCLACPEALKKSKSCPPHSLPDHFSKGAYRHFIYLSTFFGVALSKKYLFPSILKTREEVDPAFLPGRSGTYSSPWEAVGYRLAHKSNTAFTVGLFLLVSPLPTFDCIISSSSHAPSTAPFALTFDFTHLHLLHHPSVILLLCWPLVHVQVSVGRPRIQHNPILWAKQSRHCTQGTEPDTVCAGPHTWGDQKRTATLGTCCVITLLSRASVQSFHQRM